MQFALNDDNRICMGHVYQRAGQHIKLGSSVGAVVLYGNAAGHSIVQSDPGQTYEVHQYIPMAQQRVDTAMPILQDFMRVRTWLRGLFQGKE
jgi:hypothetical protein